MMHKKTLSQKNMAESVNKVVLIGHVGKDPECRTTQDGSELVTFSLATGERWKDKISGEYKERTEWHRIVIFSPGLVSLVKQYVKRGSHLYIEGALQTRKYEDKNGVVRYSTEVVLKQFGSSMVLLGSKMDGQSHSFGNEGDYKSLDIPTLDDSSSDDGMPF